MKISITKIFGYRDPELVIKNSDPKEEKRAKLVERISHAWGMLAIFIATAILIILLAWPR